jgi:NCAIR mutase (PurE)-related protein
VSTHRTADLGFARLDLDRAERTGTPEVVYAAGKTPAQTVACLEALHESGARLAWATRVDDDTAAAIRARWPEAVIDAEARCAFVGVLPEPVGNVVVLTAGTSDGPVAAEVAATLAAGGVGCTRVDDVGVAGVHRVLAVAHDVAAADAVVVVAGMDGALPSVVAGLTDRLVVAVPTSVGYGAAFEGLAALLTMLTACAPGVLVVNIDNGFGAGVAAARIVKAVARRPHRP